MLPHFQRRSPQHLRFIDALAVTVTVAFAVTATIALVGCTSKTPRAARSSSPAASSNTTSHGTRPDQRPKPQTARDADRLLMNPQSELAERASLSREDVRADVDLLLYALRFGYGGRKYHAKGVFNDVLAKLDAVSPATSSSRELLETLDTILFELPDNHLYLRSPREGFSHWRTAHTRTAKVGANAHHDGAVPWGVTKVQSPSGREVPVISITALPAPEDPAWAGFKAAAKSALGSPEIVIDLRGNRGGSDTMGAWLASLVLGRTARSACESVVRSQTLETLALGVNNWQFKLVFTRLQGKDAPSYYQTRLKEKADDYQTAKANPRPEEDLRVMRYQTGLAPGKPYGGRVRILIDADCASSCESILEFFEGRPNVVTVGENTAGSVHFADVGFLVLPRSGLVAQIPSDFWKYRDRRFIERMGYAPMVKVEPGADALVAALKLDR